MKGKPGEPDGDEEADAPEVAALFRPLDRRRIREIRSWLEGKRLDAPTPQELREFLDWVAQEIEGALSRRQSTADLIVLLNAGREELREAEGHPSSEGV